MNIFQKTTLKSLRNNKVRTLVTIIGIILSASMITAVTTFISSLQDYMLRSAIYDSGDWYASFLSVSYDKVDELRNNDKISQVVSSQNIGYAFLENSINEYKPYLFVLGADEKFMDKMPVHLISGRLPENSSEIIIPKHLQTNGGIKYDIGDVLVLDIGDRYFDGIMLNQRTGYMPANEGSETEEGNNAEGGTTGGTADGGVEEGSKVEKGSEAEKFITRETRTYTVVGHYERPDFEGFSSPGYSAITLSDKDPGSGYTCNVYFKMYSPKSVNNFIQNQAKMGFDCDYNSNVLMFSGASRYDNFYAVLYSLGAIFIGLIMFGSISLIYNAFSISVSERTKQFGLLSSVGATKKQITGSVMFEALFVSSIGVPIGILCGIGGIGVTLACIGSLFSSISGSPLSLVLCVSVPSVIIACLVALITVIISAWIPSRRATKITAIEAIRQSYDINTSARLVKTSKLTYKLFGLEGMLAKKHFKRNRRKYRTTVVSLFLSIVLFVSASSFCTYIKDSVRGAFDNYEYDIKYLSRFKPYGAKTDDSSPHMQDIYNCLSEVEGVGQSCMIKTIHGKVNIREEYLTKDFKDRFSIIEGYGNEQAFFYIVDDENFRAFLKDNNLDSDSFWVGDELVAIVSGSVTSFNYDAGRFDNYNILTKGAEEVSFSCIYTDKEEESEHVFPKIKIIAVVDNLVFGTNANTNVLRIMIPQSMKDKLLNGEIYDNLPCVYDLVFKADDHTKVYERMSNALADRGYPNMLRDYVADNETEINLVLIVTVFSYGFIVLISLISIANVFNTITTNIHLRRREFAMLKSVGMTQKGFNKMMNFECLLYGFKSLIWGLPVSVLVTFLIYKSIRGGWETRFYMPWFPMVIAVFSVFAVVFVTMLYSMNKIGKDNPIDALKLEN